MTEAMTATDARRFDRFSAFNAATVDDAFASCGCKAYQSVFTYRRWRAQGFQVQKGERSVRITTWIPLKRKNPDTGELEVYGKRPKVAAVFCRHQVEPV